MGGKINDSILQEVLFRQKLGVLATMGEEYPYTSLVGFACGEDMKRLVFATMNGTRKYSNLKRHPSVSMLINSGTNSAEDFSKAASITALGKAVAVTGKELRGLETIYLEKFPFLDNFLNDPSCALVKLEVERYIVVTGLRDVREIRVS